MNYEDIDRFIQQKKPGNSPVNISFKTRRPFKGIFIVMKDFAELKRKNLWRIVSEGSIPSYQESNDANLAKIFNGSEITRLEIPKS